MRSQSDDEFVEERIGVGKVVPQEPICGRVVGECFPREEGPADGRGDLGPALFWIEIFYGHEALFYKSLQMIVC